MHSIGDDTDIVSKEMYSFKDKGDRDVTLRPEGTAAIVRAALQHHMIKPMECVKLFYNGPMFRYERPQAGRYRQFFQIGVEHLGTAEPFADAEVISLGIHLFDEMGLSGLSVKINSIGCPVCRHVIEERIRQFIGANLAYLCPDCQRRFQVNPLRILDCKSDQCRTYYMGIPDITASHCHECHDHFSAVLEYLDSLGIPFMVDPRLVRGLSYYSRTTFEIISDQLGAQNAICGGGRYDGLIQQMGGLPTPAVGFAFGVDRAVMILKDTARSLVESNSVAVFIAPLGFQQRTQCFYLLDELRRMGIVCEMSITRNELRPQLRQANRLNAKIVVIYGEAEAEQEIAIVKLMQSGTQVTVPWDSVALYCKDALG